MQIAFEDLKGKLCRPPVLAYPSFEKSFVVETDASEYSVGAVLSHKDEKGTLHPVQFASRTMNQAERKYSVCEKEALAVVFALKKFRVYLLSQDEFTLLTDHQALRSAFKKKDVHHRLARWLDLLAEYHFTIQYRPGKANGPADYLSRQQLMEYVSKEGVEGALDLTVLTNDTVDMEPRLVSLQIFLSTLEITKVDQKDREWVKRNARNFNTWDGQLFRRTGSGLVAVAPVSAQRGILETFHDCIGHWDSNTTKQFVLERYWWPMCHKPYGYSRVCQIV